MTDELWSLKSSISSFESKCTSWTRPILFLLFYFPEIKKIQNRKTPIFDSFLLAISNDPSSFINPPMAIIVAPVDSSFQGPSSDPKVLNLKNDLEL